MEDNIKELMKCLDIIEEITYDFDRRKILRMIDEEDHENLYDHLLEAKNEIKTTIGLLYYMMNEEEE